MSTSIGVAPVAASRVSSQDLCFAPVERAQPCRLKFQVLNQPLRTHRENSDHKVLIQRVLGACFLLSCVLHPSL